MWSNNKKLNISINLLIVLLAMYFLHFSQFILPIICLLLFVDNRYKFKVVSIRSFITLLLFGISFFVFSYKLGFYSTMGFTLPMAYYIGSNMKNVDEKNVKNLIYLIAFGMSVHVLLNFAYDIYIYGSDFFIHRSHYDFWLKSIVSNPTTAVNYVIPTSVVYYLPTRENSITVKRTLLITYFLLMIYNIFLGRRTPLLMMGLVLTSGVIADFKSIKNKNRLKLIAISVIAIIVIAGLLISFNIFNVGDLFFSLHIVSKFEEYGLDAGRIELLIESFKYMPYYPFGGQHISSLIGLQIHDLWTDIYDYAGIIPYLLMIIYTIHTIISVHKLVRSTKFSSNFKLLILSVFACCFIQMCLEPIMTGSSIFIICFVIIMSSVELINSKEE